MTTADDMRNSQEMEKEIEDLREAVRIAVCAAIGLLQIGAPEIRSRQIMLTWGQLATTVELLRKEFQIEEVK